MATVGPHTNPALVTNLGVAAHITAASPNGPRFNANLSANERSAIGNGIWLCQTCAKLIDSDSPKYSVEVLERWKKRAETNAGERLNKQLSGNDKCEVGTAENREAIKQNGCYEKTIDGYTVRYFLEGDNLHVEQELANGSIGYYILDSNGNIVGHKLPYALQEYSVEIDPSLVLNRIEVALPDGALKETILMKWGKKAVLVWDSKRRLVDMHFEKGCRIDNIRKVFVIEPPQFSK